MCTQTAVYWGSPVNNGKGGFTFDDPVEIYCRWEDKREVYMGQDNKEKVSLSIVIVLQELSDQGYLYLGSLDDFTSEDDTSDPKSLSNVYQIKQFAKIPQLRSTSNFLYKAYL